MRTKIERQMEASTTRDPTSFSVASLRGCRIIGIDGDNGAGKSTLAKEIVAALGGTVVEIDNYLSGNGQPYIAQLDFTRLNEAIRTASAEPIVIEGVLLLEILQKLNIRPDKLIFAKWEWEGVQQYGISTEITDYYRRHSPWLSAQIKITLRTVFTLQPKPFDR